MLSFFLEEHVVKEFIVYKFFYQWCKENSYSTTSWNAWGRFSLQASTFCKSMFSFLGKLETGKKDTETFTCVGISWHLWFRSPCPHRTRFKIVPRLNLQPTTLLHLFSDFSFCLHVVVFGTCYLTNKRTTLVPVVFFTLEFRIVSTAMFLCSQLSTFCHRECSLPFRSKWTGHADSDSLRAPTTGRACQFCATKLVCSTRFTQPLHSMIKPL